MTLVVDGIEVRTGGELVEQAAAAQARGDDDVARALLLTGVDPHWPYPPPTLAEARAAAVAPTLREALLALRFGRVGDYLLHRWSDPTYLSGLALLRLAGSAALARGTIEVACGHGPFLRELALRGLPATGTDVVFSKLWLARRFVVPPEVRLVCVDAADPLPLADSAVGVALCHDAIYFLDPAAQATVAREMARVAPVVALGHAHVRPDEVGARPLGAWQALLPGAVAYDDAALTCALLAGSTPRPGGAVGEAVGLVRGAPVHGWATGPDLAAPVRGRALRVNPLYREAGVLKPPSPRWAADYLPRARAYLPERLPDPLPVDAVRRRLLLDLPEQW